MKVRGVDFETAKLFVAEAIGRDELIRTKGDHPFSAARLLDPPTELRAVDLVRKYLAHRLRVSPAEVPKPSTPVAGWTALPYYDPPANGQGKPVRVGEWPCSVFGTMRADGLGHAHRIYVAVDGAGKADLGTRPDGHKRDAKKSAVAGDGNTAGCAVLWGDPQTAPHIILSEGIETGAAIAFAFKDKIEAGEITVAAAITAGGIEAFQPFPATKRVTVAADRDESKPSTDAGYRRGEQVARKFAVDVDLVTGVALPGNPGESIDWLDLLFRDGAGGVADGITNAERYSPADDPEPEETIDLATAKERLVDLPEQVKSDAGAPFEPEALKAMAVLRAADPAAFTRLNDTLKKAGVSARDLNREIQKHTFRVVAGPTPGATKRAGPYRVVDGGIYHEKPTQAGPVMAPLCNFNAQIVGEEIHDDGAEQTTVFAIEGTLQSGKPLPRVDIPAERYAGMSWVTASWGTPPVMYAGQGTKDHLRTAIQMFSGDVPRRTVFGHLGWRKFGGEWIYLHAGGGIGEDGQIASVEVGLGDRLADYRLPEPPVGDDRKRAVKASLALLGLARHEVAYPLLAAVYRAPLGEADVLDLGLFLAGPTGCQKTEITAMLQAHYGAGFHGKNLPANWSATANALEKRAFLAKDAIFTVDDFAPTGTASDVQRLHREADRLWRAQGNRAGRERMRPDGSLRPTYFPRGIVISSGEDIPRGQSLRARILILEISPGEMNLARLTEAQTAASDGLFAQAMAGYLQWLAPRMESLKRDAPQRRRELRDRARQSPVVHDRTPEIVASLMLGYEMFLRYAEEVGVSVDGEQGRCWEALMMDGCRSTDRPSGERGTHRPFPVVAGRGLHLGQGSCSRRGDQPSSARCRAMGLDAPGSGISRARGSYRLARRRAALFGPRGGFCDRAGVGTETGDEPVDHATNHVEANGRARVAGFARYVSAPQYRPQEHRGESAHGNSYSFRHRPISQKRPRKAAQNPRKTAGLGLMGRLGRKW